MLVVPIGYEVVTSMAYAKSSSVPPVCDWTFCVAKISRAELTPQRAAELGLETNVAGALDLVERGHLLEPVLQTPANHIVDGLFVEHRALVGEQYLVRVGDVANRRWCRWSR